MNGTIAVMAAIYGLNVVEQRKLEADMAKLQEKPPAAPPVAPPFGGVFDGPVKA